MGQSLLQIGAGITNWSKLLQIGAQQFDMKVYYLILSHMI